VEAIQIVTSSTFGGSMNVTGGRGKTANAVRLYWLHIKKAPQDGTPLNVL
jgi:hypothetical protein